MLTRLVDISNMGKEAYFQKKNRHMVSNISLDQLIIISQSTTV